MAFLRLSGPELVYRDFGAGVEGDVGFHLVPPAVFTGPGQGPISQVAALIGQPGIWRSRFTMRAIPVWSGVISSSLAISTSSLSCLLTTSCRVVFVSLMYGWPDWTHGSAGTVIPSFSIPRSLVMSQRRGRFPWWVRRIAIPVCVSP